MVSNRFDPRRFFRQNDTVAAAFPADELFGFFARTLQLPPDWAALVTLKHGEQKLHAAGSTVPSEEAAEVLVARCTSVEVTLTEEGIISADRYRCTANLRLRLRTIPERSELASLRKHLLGSHRVVTIASLARYLQPALRRALLSFAETRDVDVLIDQKDTDKLRAAIQQELSGPCFEAGLALDGSVDTQFHSDTYRQVRVTAEAAARRRDEHDAQRQLEQALETAQAAHMSHLEELLGRLKTVADESPQAKIGDLLKTFSETERGELYEALFAAQPPATTKWLVVAAGNELLYYDPASPQEPVRRVPLPDTVGALRSVQCVSGSDGSAVVLIGAACGVHEMAPEENGPAFTYPTAKRDGLRGGINAATLAGSQVVASHSELGLLMWERSQTSEAIPILTDLTGDARAIRHVQHTPGGLFFSADERVIQVPADRMLAGAATVYSGSQAVITALWTDQKRVLAGNTAGQVLEWTLGDPKSLRVLHSGHDRAVESLELVEHDGVERLFFTDTSSAIHARVLGDTFACRYEAGGQTIRRAEVAADWIVGTNELRDRLMLWSLTSPAQPMHVIPVSRTCGRSIQDICLLANA